MSGEVFYIAKVKENAFPFPFKLISSSPTRAVFENRTHDFPNRIEYQFQDSGELHVTVGDGARRSFVMRFERKAGKEEASEESKSGLQQEPNR